MPVPNIIQLPPILFWLIAAGLFIGIGLGLITNPQCDIRTVGSIKFRLESMLHRLKIDEII
jgi:hypothetical protein